MTFMLCKEHGRQGFYEVCAHVDDALRNGRHISCEQCVSVLACERCIDAHDLRRFPSHVLRTGDWDGDEAAEARAYESARAGAWCAACIDSAVPGFLESGDFLEAI